MLRGANLDRLKGLAKGGLGRDGASNNQGYLYSMPDHMLFGLSAIIALLPSSFLPLRRDHRPDALYWLVLLVAVAGPMNWVLASMAGASPAVRQAGNTASAIRRSGSIVDQHRPGLVGGQAFQAPGDGLLA